MFLHQYYTARTEPVLHGLDRHEYYTARFDASTTRRRLGCLRQLRDACDGSCVIEYGGVSLDISVRTAATTTAAVTFLEEDGRQRRRWQRREHGINMDP